MPDAQGPARADALLAAASARLEAAGIDRPVFEAQLLLALALGRRREDVLCGVPEPVPADAAARFAELTDRRAAREPMAYLRGTQEFYGLEFAVSPAVLVPRPETELLVETVLEAVRSVGAPVIADVGTGSGCVAVTVAVRHPGARVLALDVSLDALAVAGENARRHGVADRVLAVHGDLLAPVPARSVDVVVSNPPYIASDEVDGLQAEVRLWEPRVALDGGADGMELVRRIVEGALRTARPGGLLALEVALGQAVRVCDLLRQAGLRGVTAARDLAGIHRVASGRLPGEPGQPTTEPA